MWSGVIWVTESQVPIWNMFCKICRYKEAFCVCSWHSEAAPWWVVFLPFHLPSQVRLHWDPRWGQWGSRPAGQALWEHSTSYHHLFWPLSLYQVHLRLRTARCWLLPALRDLQDRWEFEVWASACLLGCLPRSSSRGYVFGHLISMIFSMFSGDKGFFFSFFFLINLIKSVVSHFQEGKDVSDAWLYNVASKAGFLLKFFLVLKD